MGPTDTRTKRTLRAANEAASVEPAAGAEPVAFDTAKPVDQPAPKHIDAADFAKIPDDEKPRLMGGVHNNVMHHPNLSEAMYQARLLGYAQARADGRPPTDVVVILAHHDATETFFVDHPKLDDKQRARMIAALSIDETAHYEMLVDAEKGTGDTSHVALASDGTQRIAAKKARLEFEREWSTRHWRWKRYFAEFFPTGEGWSARWIYHSEFKKDPIYLDAKHPCSGVFHEMTELVPAGDGVKHLIIAGNMLSAQTGVQVPEKKTVETDAADAVAVEPAAPEFQSADDYAASLAAQPTATE